MFYKHLNLNSVLIFTAFIVLFSCNKENEQTTKQETQEKNIKEEESDTNLTAEEIFSTSLVQEIAGTDDIDLQIFLEEQFYPAASKSNKVTLDRISSSLYLLSYDENGTMKNFLIQKFYNAVEDEFIFDKSETQINAVKQFMK